MMHPPGSIVTMPSGAKYEVQADGAWKRLLVALLLCLLPVLASAQVPLQPDWTRPGRVYGPEDGVPSIWQAAQAPASVPAGRGSPRRMRLGIYSGAVAPLSSGADLAVYPAVRVAVEAPTANHRAAPALHVLLDVGGTPGETLAIEDPTTFRSVSLEVGLSQPLWPGVFYPSFYFGAGFASRMPGDKEPRVRAPKWALAGIQFQTDNRKARLVLAVGGDQRISTSSLYATWEPAVQVQGHVVIRTFKVPLLNARASVMLVGDASLHIEMYPSAVGASRPRDMYRLGVLVGGGA